MKLYSILIIRKNDGEKSKILASSFDLSSFGYFQRGSMQEVMNFSAITISDRTNLGERQVVESEHNVARIYAHPKGISGMIISDKEYVPRVAFSLLNKIMDEFLTQFPTDKWKEADTIEYPKLNDYLKDYQNPEEVDPIMKVQMNLDDTKAIMHKTIEGLLQRGEKLDSLIDRSEVLSNQSKMFYKAAKKTNSCCVVM